jgi:hypothetical protein
MSVRVRNTNIWWITQIILSICLIVNTMYICLVRVSTGLFDTCSVLGCIGEKWKIDRSRRNDRKHNNADSKITRVWQPADYWIIPAVVRGIGQCPGSAGITVHRYIRHTMYYIIAVITSFVPFFRLFRSISQIITMDHVQWILVLLWIIYYHPNVFSRCAYDCDLVSLCGRTQCPSNLWLLFHTTTRHSILFWLTYALLVRLWTRILIGLLCTALPRCKYNNLNLISVQHNVL